MYHIQALLVDELDNYKGKENKYVEVHIKKIQDTYKWDDLGMKTLQIIDKEKQQVQDEEMNNLEKYMKYMQTSIKTIPFYLPSYYKTIQPQEEYDE